jgi:phosphohistidine phosphatase SixA
LQQLPEHKRVLLVGHSPSLPERVRRLLGMREMEAIKMPKGALVCVKTDDGLNGRLKFFVTPKLLGREAPGPSQSPP